MTTVKQAKRLVQLGYEYPEFHGWEDGYAGKVIRQRTEQLNGKKTKTPRIPKTLNIAKEPTMTTRIAKLITPKNEVIAVITDVPTITTEEIFATLRKSTLMSMRITDMIKFVRTTKSTACRYTWTQIVESAPQVVEAKKEEDKPVTKTVTQEKVKYTQLNEVEAFLNEHRWTMLKPSAAQVGLLAKLYNYSTERVREIIAQKSWTMQDASHYIDQAIKAGMGHPSRPNPKHDLLSVAQENCLVRWGVPVSKLLDLPRAEATLVISKGRKGALEYFEVDTQEEYVYA